jgi:site-specific DNA-methyltransferase (adenine-specific)
MLDEQSGESTSRIGEPRVGRNGDGWGMSATGAEYADTGGASRFFYCAKASRGERNAGLDEKRRVHPGNNADERVWDIPGSHSTPRANVHPTVKPIDLMRWLVRLVTPPGGIVLDPFAGSGTTGIAAHLEGARFIGIEREAEYAEIARARLAWWSEIPPGTEIEAALGYAARETAITESGQGSLL